MADQILGKTRDGTPVRLDVDSLIASRLLIQANSGAGKSWAICRLLEQTHGRIQHVVLNLRVLPPGECAASVF